MELNVRNLSSNLNKTDNTNLNTDTCLQWPTVTFETGSTATPYIVNAVLNSFLAVLVTASNILVFLAIRKCSLRLPSKVLLSSLVVADLGAGLVAQPLFVIFLCAKVERRPAIMCISINAASIVGASLAGGSMLTMTLMSIDRFVAFHFPLKYRQIVTVRRVSVALLSVWLMAALNAPMWLWNTELFYNLVPVLVGLCTLFTSLVYVSIYRGLRKQHGIHRVNTEAQIPKPHQEQHGTTDAQHRTTDAQHRTTDAQHRATNEQHRATNAQHVSNYRKSASAMLWVYSIFLLCYLPFVCCVALIQVTGVNLLKRNIFEIAQTILLVNSSINPYVYCWRISGIRAGVLKTVRKVCGQT